MMKDPSLLVRASAAISLGMYPTKESLESLIEASEDEYRLVRVRAASGLARFSCRLGWPHRTSKEWTGLWTSTRPP